jgi:hypothetical protein
MGICLQKYKEPTNPADFQRWILPHTRPFLSGFCKFDFTSLIHSMKKHLILSLFYLVLGLFSCGEAGKNESLVTNEVAEELKARDPRRVTEAELIERAYHSGRQIADSAQKALQQKLLGAIQKGGVPYAVDFCNLTALPLMDSLSEAYDTEIRRVSHRVRNPQDMARDYESAILEAYVYNAEQGEENQENIQKVGDEYLLYTRPIVIGNGLCLNCHGEPGTQVLEETLAAIEARYPNDQALHHELNDLRGMWSIRLSRRMLVLKEDEGQ